MRNCYIFATNCFEKNNTATAISDGKVIAGLVEFNC